MTKQERQKKYNNKFRQEHPEYVNEWVKKRYRTNIEYQKQVKYNQKKNYWKKQGYNYEVQIIPITEFDTNADEVKITRNGNSWIVEIKTKINE